ncbi:MAG: TolC family outer membrane protein [Pseudomonadota bacterium]
MKAWIVAIAMGLSAMPAGAESLADALTAAYRNSSLLDQNRALLRVSDEGVASAVAALRPIIAFAGSATWSKADTTLGGVPVTVEGLSSSASLTAEMTLLDFGRSRLGIEIARETVLATREALVAVEQDVLFAAVDAYVSVRLAEEVVALRNNNVRVITEELRGARDRFDVGEATRTDVALAESGLASARANLAAAEGDLMVARESYRAATGAYPGRLGALPRLPKLPRNLEEAETVAMRNHPSIRQAQREVTVATLNADLARAGYGPTLSGRAAVSVEDGGRETRSLSLNLNQTIYAGGAVSSALRRALANQDAARAGLRQTSVNVAQNLGNAWARLAVSNASIEASERQIRAAQTAFDGIREEAALGARTTLDVLDAEQRLLDARNLRLQAEANRYREVFNVLRATGLLTVDHLQLGIPTYDPAAYSNAVRNAPSHSPQGKKLDRILEKIGN